MHKKSIKIYVGSAKNASVRPFKHLFKSTKTNLHLKNALKKYGLLCFVLIIFKIVGNMETVSSEKLQQMEDLYLKSIQQKYHFLEKAFTSTGYKYTPESLNKIKNKRLGTVLSEQTKNKLCMLFSGEKIPFLEKTL
uniref:Hypothetical GIY-YIG homing endonuclease n=1 Tax=Ourococcus multisporus TaxID=132186 RepID=A0A076VI64_9CHLO|nr:hypothetical GIY-YIG homing endonuclease [Ourococcus multisporus]AIK29174.1 hypothetical GIY-YIG homing endonuclease [Ourococcus multisporus]